MKHHRSCPSQSNGQPPPSTDTIAAGKRVKHGVVLRHAPRSLSSEHRIRRQCLRSSSTTRRLYLTRRSRRRLRRTRPRPPPWSRWGTMSTPAMPPSTQRRNGNGDGSRSNGTPQPSGSRKRKHLTRACRHRKQQQQQQQQQQQPAAATTATAAAATTATAAAATTIAAATAAPGGRGSAPERFIVPYQATRGRDGDTDTDNDAVVASTTDSDAFAVAGDDRVAYESGGADVRVIGGSSCGSGKPESASAAAQRDERLACAAAREVTHLWRAAMSSVASVDVFSFSF